MNTETTMNPILLLLGAWRNTLGAFLQGVQGPAGLSGSYGALFGALRADFGIRAIQTILKALGLKDPTEIPGSAIRALPLIDTTLAGLTGHKKVISRAEKEAWAALRAALNSEAPAPKAPTPGPEAPEVKAPKAPAPKAPAPKAPAPKAPAPKA